MISLEVGVLKEGTLCPEVKGFRVEDGLIIRVRIPLPDKKTIIHSVGGILEVEVTTKGLKCYAPIKLPGEIEPDNLVAEYSYDQVGDNLRIFIPYRD